MGSSSSHPISDRSVLIVGAGYAGRELAIELQNYNINFTIISPRNYFHHNNASVRAIVEPGTADRTMMPLDPTFGDRVKLGKVVDVRRGERVVVLESGEEVKYDILVIATGSSGQFPFKLDTQNKEEAVRMYADMMEKIVRSRRIAVVGGGTTGIEVIGELATEFSNKEIILVSSSEELVVPGLGSKFKTRLDNILSSMKVKVVKGERVSNLEELDGEGPYTIKTDKGTELEVDLCIKCLGLHTNHAAYRNSFGDSVTESGMLKVNEFFEVEGENDVYAIGDCCNTPETKLALLALEHGKLLAANLRRKLLNKKQTPYVPDKNPTTAVVSIGRRHGLAEHKNGMMIPEFIIVSLKSKTMQIPDNWKRMRQPIPK